MSSISYPVSRPRFSLQQALISIFIGLLIFTFSVIVFLAGTQFWYAGRIYPGVRAAGIDVGGMRPQEAAEQIAALMSFPDQGKIVLRDGSSIWIASPAQLGLSIDPQSTARRAYEAGRNGHLIARLQEQFEIWYHGYDVPPSMVFDERVAYAYLEGLAREINTPTVEASLELAETEVIVRPGKIGRTLDIPRSLTLISVQLQKMQDGILELFVNESAPVILDASEQADLARAILSEPLTLVVPDQDGEQLGPWTIEPAALAEMLVFERVETEGKMHYQVRLREDMLRDYLTEVAPHLSRAPQNAQFIFNDETRQLDLIRSAVIGRDLDVEGSIEVIQEKVYAGEHVIPLTMTYTDPPITDQVTGEQLGITELVHAETSYFYGSSAARVQNIATAASKFHGVFVAPGETFSMADALGDITLDNGYAEASIILGGQTIKGVGGGVCQVSTTLFRAAFFAGFPIVERHAHAYRVYYYEKVAGNRVDPKLSGLDATVFVPLVDFKFTNDTPYWLLMETYVNPSASSITWKFYSTSDGRQVNWTNTGPTNVVPAPKPTYRENPELPSGTIKQVDWAADGADVTVTRTVMKDGAVHLQDTIYTHYQPWGDVFEYGPGTEIPTEKSEPEG
ncbi:MAG: hypothetical protein GX491_18700 [Chloroflexi bacterium]|mgnify:CR=1 FL=1|nr:hypothetical protein [Chloroflexota bacterium]